MYALIASDVGVLLVKPLYKREKTVIKAKKNGDGKQTRDLKKTTTAIEKKKNV